MTKAELSGNWNYPTSIVAAAGAITQLADCCDTLGVTRPLLVTDPVLATLPMVRDSLSICRAQGIEADLFSRIKCNPTSQNVSEGVAAFRAGDHDGVIALGGGSAMDAAKAIALMVGQHRPLWDFVDFDDNWLLAEESGIAPVVAVPTTAGTGSEVGRAALITDEARQLKRIIFHPRLLPERVILDPLLTVGLPADITAATGMDALSHNLEALCAPAYHPMADGIAVQGIRLIGEFLPQAVEEGTDVKARMQMLVASSMGATAFQKGLGAMHALAHPLGALYDSHHGLLNAILMPYVLVANQSVVGPQLQAVARYIGLPNPGFDSFLQWILRLRKRVGIPNTLAEIGIDKAQIKLVGEMAAADPTAASNPINFSANQYSDLFAKAVTGEL